VFGVCGPDHRRVGTVRGTNTIAHDSFGACNAERHTRSVLSVLISVVLGLGNDTKPAANMRYCFVDTELTLPAQQSVIILYLTRSFPEIDANTERLE
jgi:hypothetical protein